MKFIFKATAAIFISAIAIFGNTTTSIAQVAAPDPTDRVLETTFTIDKLGDATVLMTEKMNQSQWENFKSGPLVNDPSISKRNMARSMSAYVIEDFNRDIQDMSRTVKMTFKVKASAQYDGGGKWEFKLDSKNPKVTKLPDNSYMLTSNSLLGNELTQQIITVVFPSGVSDIQQQTDSFGKTIFTYSLGGGVSAFLTWNNILGFLFIVGALFLFLRPQQKLLSGGPNKGLIANS